MPTNISFPDIQLPSYGLVTKREDNTIRSNMENGIVLTRRKYTKARKTFELSWDSINTTQRDTLIQFYDSVGCYRSFNWLNPADNTTYIVRFKEPIEETINFYNVYTITAKFEEV